MDDTIYHSTPQSAICYNRSSTTHGIEQNILDRLIPNSKYYISVWVRLSNAPERNQLVKLKVKFVDDDGPHWRGISTTLPPSSIGTWNKLEGYVTVQTRGVCTAAKIFVEGPDAGIDFHVDDFEMEFVEASTVQPTGSPTKVSLY